MLRKREKFWPQPGIELGLLCHPAHGIIVYLTETMITFHPAHGIIVYLTKTMITLSSSPGIIVYLTITSHIYPVKIW
jgi:hypothetical protein